MPELPRLLGQPQRAFEGDAWSGPSLFATLDGLGAAQFAALLLAGAYSIGAGNLNYVWLHGAALPLPRQAGGAAAQVALT